ncbi:MAG TPA: hypothetical protein VHP37_04015 [Burkholderiales bacterium]|nr:hypothetical protein [Burkholderiales bacterium]
MTRLLARAAALAASALLCPTLFAAQLAFGAFGDIPYNRDEEPALPAIIAEMNREKLAFAIHVGDFKDARTECSDRLFLERLETFGLSHHPFFYTPGDNEWVDCRRARWAPRDPLERLARLRELFFASDSSLGQRALPAQRQAARGYPENMRWIAGDVVCATLNIPGPDNHRSAMPAESKRRTPAVLDWMREAFRTARERKAPAVVLATQADLFSGSSAYAEILQTLADESRRYAGEVLILHGDTHVYRFDKPLVDAKTGAAVANVSRVEVPGSPFVNWVYVTVTVEDGRARFGAIPGSDIATRNR